VDDLLKGCETRWRKSLTKIMLNWIVDFSRVTFDCAIDDQVSVSGGMIDYIGGDNPIVDSYQENDRIFAKVSHSFFRKERREFFIPKLNREQGLYGSEFKIQLRNKLTQRAIARECVSWIKDSVATPFFYLLLIWR